MDEIIYKSGDHYKNQFNIMATLPPKSKLIVKHCTIKQLSEEQQIEAAKKAIQVNSLNAPQLHSLRRMMPGITANPLRLAMATKKYWGIKGVKLTVGFLDNPPQDLRRRLLSHMNAWGKFCNVKFVASIVNPQVRISRSTPAPDNGYWSYLGTDILSVHPDEPTMNLEDFTMNTSDAEFYRVVRHETGHTLGFEHEHMRKEIVSGIDVEKAVKYFKKTEGWSRKDVIDQVLTPLESSALIATAKPDPKSIMCYWLPAEIMKDGKAIPGGKDINKMDAKFATQQYPPKKPKH